MKAGILGMAFLGAVASVLPSSAHAGSGVPGVVVGAGGGALIGQAIGRNTESTLVGAAIGGVVGALANMEPRYSRYDNQVYYSRPVEYRTVAQPVEYRTVVRPVPSQTVYVYADDRDDDRRHRHHHNRWHHRDHEERVIVRDWERTERYR